MTGPAAPVVRVQGLRKDYGGLRPLRLDAFVLEAGARVVILGVDGPAAEVLVNLLTGATLPEAGTVEVFGRRTSTITDADDWIRTLDRFGVVSCRAVLVEPLTIGQNLAMAFTLSVDPMSADVAARVERLGREAGLGPDDLTRPCAESAPGVRARCHFARALAMDPQVLILEHANAFVEAGDAPKLGEDVARVAGVRAAAVLALTADERFAKTVGNDVYRYNPATGALRRIAGWRRWLGGR